jgi:RNA 3'-terminal phosphate cyclase
VDEYLQDQLVLFCALAPGKSRFKCGPMTLHTETSIYFTQMLTGAKFTVTKTPAEEKMRSEESSFIVECDGIGLVNKYL